MPSNDASGFHPPAPTALVTLYDPSTGASLPGVPLLLDIGSDVTLVPRAAIERLGVAPETDPSIELVGFDGTRSLAPLARRLVSLLRRAYRGRYMLVDGESGILGRVILNQLVLLFDGPRQQWSEHAPQIP
jgi:hypothetical protein